MTRKTLLAVSLLALLASGVALAAQTARLDAAQSDTAGATAVPRGHLAQLDKNGDGVIDRSEAAAAPRLAEHFDQIDTNKDGKLSADERAQARRGMGHERHGKWKALDTDKDGRVSRAEAAADPKLSERFAELDTDKNGYLDREDFRARAEQRQAECFVKADADKDGKLSPEEFSSVRETCHGPRGRMMAAPAQAPKS